MIMIPTTAWRMPPLTIRPLDEAALMHKARHRHPVPPVQQGELVPLTDPMPPPAIKFHPRKLPWRKFHMPTNVTEPRPPDMPTIERPEISHSPHSASGDSSIDADTKPLMDAVGKKFEGYGRALLPHPNEQIMEMLKTKDAGAWARRVDPLQIFAAPPVSSSKVDTGNVTAAPPATGLASIFANLLHGEAGEGRRRRRRRRRRR